MPGMLEAMALLDWVGMAAVVITYCVCGYRLGRGTA